MNTEDKNLTFNMLLEVFPICQKIIMHSINFHNLEITKTQLCIMLALNGHDRLNMTQLSHYIASSKEQTTRAVAPLVKSGYLERSYDDNNRTYVFVKLTDEGREFLHFQKERFNCELKDKYASLSDDDKKAFSEAVKTSLTILKKLE